MGSAKVTRSEETTSHFHEQSAAFRSGSSTTRPFSDSTAPMTLIRSTVVSYLSSVSMRDLQLVLVVCSFFKHRNRTCSFFFREGEDGTWDVLGATVTPDQRTAYTVNELKPYTAYSFRVLGVNDLGQGTPSNASYFIFTHRQRESGPPVSKATSLCFSVTFPSNGRRADIL